MYNARDYINFPDGSFVFHACGAKDDWCVYYKGGKGPDFKVIVPLDRQYFKSVVELGVKYGANKVYDDFVKIYNLTTDKFDENVIKVIWELSTSYVGSELRVKKVFAILYLAMISEFYYVTRKGEPSKLNKRVKRLGMHQVLFRGLDPKEAANFSRHKSYEEINALCEEYGF